MLDLLTGEIHVFSTARLRLEKWGAEMFALFESFVYRNAAHRTLSKLARKVEYRGPPVSGISYDSA